MRKRWSNSLVLLVGIGLVTYSIWSDRNSPPVKSDKVTQSCPHLPFGTPTGTPETNDFICREAYALSSNDETKFADWVAYRVTAAQLRCETPDQRDWEADPAIAPSETLEPNDYQGTGRAGYDRGHQAPLASLKCLNWREANYLSNITPQNPELNRGPWKELEEYERSLAKKHGEIFVITGPAYEEEMGKLPGADENHLIPSGYWKILYLPKRKVLSYYFNQDANGGEISMAEIEEKSNLQFGESAPRTSLPKLF
ncbi:MAG: DNA/RNA non-specific endonuclease [Okeania sp. SIO2D1]|nr:DNA/RNA non-specific endonuclease [Okeania sp. SIO2D1]